MREVDGESTIIELPSGVWVSLFAEGIDGAAAWDVMGAALTLSDHPGVLASEMAGILADIAYAFRLASEAILEHQPPAGSA